MKITNVDIQENDKLVTMALEGKMISAIEKRIYLEFIEEQLKKGTVNFILDFSGLEFINSSGIGAIIQSLKKINGVDGKMSVCSCRKNVEDVFTITRMQKKIGLCKTKDDAREYINS